MDTLPRVSVVIPVLNDQTGINRCVRALFEVEYPLEKLEVLIVDNGSDPRILVESSDMEIKVLTCSTPGSYAARNVGVLASTGCLLAFTDADCVADPRWIANGVKAIMDQAGSCIVGGEVELLAPLKPTAVGRYQCMMGSVQRRNIEAYQFSATANLFATKSQMELVGYFRENLLSGGDLEWCWRALDRGFRIEYAVNAVVRTAPRNSLRDAIKQARRVAGGRYALAYSGIPLGRRGSATSDRFGVKAVSGIMSRVELPFTDRVRVLLVASILRLVQVLEIVRLSLGMRPERG